MLSKEYYPYARAITLGCYFGLIAVIFYGCWFFGPEGETTKDVAAKIVLWLLVVSGLLLVIRGLLKGLKRSYIWLCYILLMYFVLCVQSLFSGGSDVQSTAAWHEIFAVTVIVLGFVSSMIASRTSSQ